MNEKLIKEIEAHCRHSEKVHKASSYHLKHLFEALTGSYFSNFDFRLAMVASGFKPTKSSQSQQNCFYKVRIVGDIPKDYNYLKEGENKNG